MKLNGLSLAAEKTEVLLIVRTKKRKYATFTVEERTITTADMLKYIFRSLLVQELGAKRVFEMIKASFLIIDYGTDVHEHVLVSEAIIGTGVIGVPSNVS